VLVAASKSIFAFAVTALVMPAVGAAQSHSNPSDG
jgi:hypothetical protein